MANDRGDTALMVAYLLIATITIGLLAASTMALLAEHEKVYELCPHGYQGDGRCDIETEMGFDR